MAALNTLSLPVLWLLQIRYCLTSNTVKLLPIVASFMNVYRQTSEHLTNVVWFVQSNANLSCSLRCVRSKYNSVLDRELIAIRYGANLKCFAGSRIIGFS